MKNWKMCVRVCVWLGRLEGEEVGRKEEDKELGSSRKWRGISTLNKMWRNEKRRLNVEY